MDRSGPKDLRELATQAEHRLHEIGSRMCPETNVPVRDARRKYDCACATCRRASYEEDVTNRDLREAHEERNRTLREQAEVKTLRESLDLLGSLLELPDGLRMAREHLEELDRREREKTLSELPRWRRLLRGLWALSS